MAPSQGATSQGLSCRKSDKGVLNSSSPRGILTARCGSTTKTTTARPCHGGRRELGVPAPAFLFLKPTGENTAPWCWAGAGAGEQTDAHPAPARSQIPGPRSGGDSCPEGPCDTGHAQWPGQRAAPGWAAAFQQSPRANISGRWGGHGVGTSSPRQLGRGRKQPLLLRGAETPSVCRFCGGRTQDPSSLYGHRVPAARRPCTLGVPGSSGQPAEEHWALHTVTPLGEAPTASCYCPEEAGTQLPGTTYSTQPQNRRSPQPPGSPPSRPE